MSNTSSISSNFAERLDSVTTLRQLYDAMDFFNGMAQTYACSNSEGSAQKFDTATFYANMAQTQIEYLAVRGVFLANIAIPVQEKGGISEPEKGPF